MPGSAPASLAFSQARSAATSTLPPLPGSQERSDPSSICYLPFDAETLLRPWRGFHELCRPAHADDIALQLVDRLRPCGCVCGGRRTRLSEDARESELRRCLQVEEVGRRGQIDRLAGQQLRLRRLSRGCKDLSPRNAPHHLGDDVVLPRV